MAKLGTSLIIQCETTSGVKTWTFNYAKSSATTANIQAFVQALIANGDIYKYVPLAATSIKLQTVSEATIPVPS